MLCDEDELVLPPFEISFLKEGIHLSSSCRAEPTRDGTGLKVASPSSSSVLDQQTNNSHTHAA